MSNIAEFIDVATLAAKRASKIILENLETLSREDVDVKTASDYVTRIDRESERVIIDTIRGYFPDHYFLAEESLKETATDNYRWIIDPLDGTTNYIHGYPMFAVSIALEFEKRIISGVVYDPLRDEMFAAGEGEGALLNGSRIRVSASKSLSESLITTGFPFRQKDKLDMYLEAFRRIFLKVSGIRRAGAAALDFAYLACGKCDGFFELGLSPWDVAAGSILITEAGGIITDFSGGKDYLQTGNIVAGIPSLHRELLEEVKSVFTGTIDK